MVVAGELATLQKLQIQLVVLVPEQRKKRSFSFSFNTLVSSIVENLEQYFGLEKAGLFVPPSEGNDGMWLLPYLPIWVYGPEQFDFVELKSIDDETRQNSEGLQVQLNLPGGMGAYLLHTNPNLTFSGLLSNICEKFGLEFSEEKYRFFYHKNQFEGKWIDHDSTIASSNIQVLVRKKCTFSNLKLEICFFAKIVEIGLELERRVLFSSFIRREKSIFGS